MAEKIMSQSLDNWFYFLIWEPKKNNLIYKTTKILNNLCNLFKLLEYIIQQFNVLNKTYIQNW